ncbi:hypothetical protein [Streptomyces sp. NPDC006691]|uniref:hypothetical protein n=1 Tax=Streptomyces sp. NPDC006691 TaxID=3364757 RepID=UPI00368B8FA8
MIGRGLVAAAIACAGVAAAPAAAQAAPAGTTASAVSAAMAATAATASACSTDTGAKGLASSPVSDSLVSVGRTDGRIAQFQLFYDSTATRGLPFVWHREQLTPGGAYGAWQRVSAATVGPKSYYITAMENSAGAIELLFSTYGTFCHSVENGSAGGWSEPDAFGLAPTPYHGGVILFKERDGSIDAFASGSRNGSTMELRHQQNAASGWGPVQSTGTVPGQDVGLSQPSTVEQLPDGRLHLTAREWNRDRTWEIYQTSPGGGWGPWQLVSPTAGTTLSSLAATTARS